MLKPNDFVKYHVESEDLHLLGYVLGRLYKVMADANGLYVRPVKTASVVYILDAQGEPTDAADHFSKVKVETDLPIGVSN